MLFCRNKEIEKKSLKNNCKFLCNFLVLFLIVCLSQLAQARQISYVVVDAFSGKIITEKGADIQRFPASLTKKMTLYIIFDQLKRGNISLNTNFLVSNFAASQSRSKLNLVAGEYVTVKTIIEALIVKSANDAAVVAAEGIAGSVKNFVEIMNIKAYQLGMYKTHFCNPSGLPDNNQKTTAMDMAILSKAIFAHFYEFTCLFKMHSFVYKKTRYFTHNSLLDKFKGTNGMKTGFTCSSGYNLSASVIRYDLMKRPYHLFIVVLGANDKYERDRKVIELAEPIFLRRQAVFYDANTAVFTKGIGFFDGKKRKMKKCLLRAPIITKDGMKELFEQYMEKTDRSFRDVDSFLHSIYSKKHQKVPVKALRTGNTKDVKKKPTKIKSTILDALKTIKFSNKT